jgi:chromosome segregation ATPase
MDTIPLTDINTLSQEPPEQIEEQTDIAYLLHEISQLKKENQYLKEQIAKCRTMNQVIGEKTRQLREDRDNDHHDIGSLRSENQSLKEQNQDLQERQNCLQKQLEQCQETIALERAHDRQRIAKLENRKPEPTKKTTAHIDVLHRLMAENKASLVSIAMAAKFLGLCKERVRQMKSLIMADGRFELGWDRLRGQRPRVVIKLRQFIRAST